MTGYLQRIAASTVRPPRAVHPLVGTMFAKQSSPDFGDPETSTEVLLPPHGMQARGPEHSPSANADLVASQQQATDRVQHEREQLSSTRAGQTARSTWPLRTEAPANAPDAAIYHEPLVPGWRQDVTPRGSGLESTTGANSASLRFQREGDQISGPQAGPAEQAPAHQSIAFAPRSEPADDVPKQAAGPDPAAERTSSAVLVRGVEARREAVSKLSQQREAAPRGGDDIQIHIGRIEVIAVPQQQQRAAPAKAPRGETLEAYLKRHERRSR
jgi:hypothetical protein